MEIGHNTQRQLRFGAENEDGVDRCHSKHNFVVNIEEGEILLSIEQCFAEPDADCWFSVGPEYCGCLLQILLSVCKNTALRLLAFPFLVDCRGQQEEGTVGTDRVHKNNNEVKNRWHLSILQTVKFFLS